MFGKKINKIKCYSKKLFIVSYLGVKQLGVKCLAQGHIGVSQRI